MKSGREQEERRRGEETRRGEEKRGEEEEEDEKREEKEEDEDEEEATDIKSNNPHLAGGEKGVVTSCLGAALGTNSSLLNMVIEIVDLAIHSMVDLSSSLCKRWIQGKLDRRSPAVSCHDFNILQPWLCQKKMLLNLLVYHGLPEMVNVNKKRTGKIHHAIHG